MVLELLDGLGLNTLGDGADIAFGTDLLCVVSLGCGKKLGIVHKVDDCCSHYLTCIEHALVSDGGLALSNDLPGVARCVGCQCNGVDLSCRADPAYIANVGRAAHGLAGGIVGHDKVVEGAALVLLDELDNLFAASEYLEDRSTWN